MSRASRRLAGVLLIILPTVMVGSFVWGALSDRLGTRAVVLGGGVLLGLSLVTASQAATLGQFQLLFGGLVGVGAGSFYAPMMALTTHGCTRHRRRAVALVSSGLGLGPMTVGPLARWLITTYDWSLAVLVIGHLAWLLVLPAAWRVRHPPALPLPAVPAALEHRPLPHDHSYRELYVMKYFALFYDVVEDFVSRRSAHREEHLRRAREANRRGELVLAGALTEPADRALLVFRAADRSVVEEFARNDPYVASGLVTRWEVRSWAVVIGDDALDASSKAV